MPGNTYLENRNNQNDWHAYIIQRISIEWSQPPSHRDICHSMNRSTPRNSPFFKMAWHSFLTKLVVFQWKAHWALLFLLFLNTVNILTCTLCRYISYCFYTHWEWFVNRKASANFNLFSFFYLVWFNGNFIKHAYYFMR